MSRVFISNMKDFMSESGAIAQSSPKRVQRLAVHLGKIVEYVTAQPELNHQKIVSCWNKINKKRCSGKIDASIDLSSFDVLWHCLHCGDHGSIKHWEHTVWDGKHR